MKLTEEEKQAKKAANATRSAEASSQRLENYDFRVAAAMWGIPDTKTLMTRLSELHRPHLTGWTYH